MVRIAKDPRLSFGKHKGKCLSQVPLSYLRWLLGSGLSRVDLRLAVEREIGQRASERLEAQQEWSHYDKWAEWAERNEGL